MLRVYDKVMDIWDLLWFVDGYIIIQRVVCFLFPTLGEEVQYLTQKNSLLESYFHLQMYSTHSSQCVQM